MSRGLNSPDADALFARHRIVLRHADDAAATGAALDTQRDIGRLIDRFGQAIGAPDRRTAGSLFVKRYCSVIAGALELWAHCGERLYLGPGGVEARMSEDGELTFLVLKPDRSIDPAGDCSTRDDEALRHLMAEGACRVLGLAAAHARVAKAVLWAHVSYLLVYRFEEWLREAGSAELRERLEGLYVRLFERPDVAWFPGYGAVPLTNGFRRIGNPLREGETIMVRSKCCLSFRLPGGDRYCYTCPLVSDDDKLNRYARLYG